MEYQQYATLHYYANRHLHTVADVREEDIMRAAVHNWSARIDRAAWAHLTARVRVFFGFLKNSGKHPHTAVAA